jgi:hypothetical protein
MTTIKTRLALRRARKVAEARKEQAGTGAAADPKEQQQRAAHKATMDFYMKAGR